MALALAWSAEERERKAAPVSQTPASDGDRRKTRCTLFASKTIVSRGGRRKTENTQGVVQVWRLPHDLTPLTLVFHSREGRRGCEGTARTSQEGTDLAKTS